VHVLETLQAGFDELSIDQNPAVVLCELQLRFEVVDARFRAVDLDLELSGARQGLVRSAVDLVQFAVFDLLHGSSLLLPLFPIVSLTHDFSLIREACQVSGTGGSGGLRANSGMTYGHRSHLGR